LNTVGLAFTLGCFGIAVALAHPLAAFFRIPKLAPVTIVACLALIPQGFRNASLAQPGRGVAPMQRRSAGAMATCQLTR
jgi:hypothetical protein